MISSAGNAGHKKQDLLSKQPEAATVLFLLPEPLRSPARLMGWALGVAQGARLEIR
jgi:hypothetical protein